VLEALVHCRLTGLGVSGWYTGQRESTRGCWLAMWRCKHCRKWVVTILN